MKPYVPQPLPLKNMDWTLFIELIGKANAALARFDGVIRGITNPFVLLSPLSTNEAVLSSKMEGTQATLQEVLFYEALPSADDPKTADIQEIINYRKALAFAVENMKKRPINLNLIKDLHERLMDSVRGANKRPGKFRTEQNWIGPYGAPIEAAYYIPPEPSRIIDDLSNFERYIHFNERDKLVQLAVVHAQFEIIHPFMDGNGRLGRMLIPLFLYGNGLLAHPCFYMSEYLEINRDEYNQGLRNISNNGDWNTWITFFMKAVISQADANSQKAMLIIQLYEEMKREIYKLASTFSLPALDTLFEFPIFSSPDFVKYSQIPRASAARLLKNMTQKKLLDVIQEGKGKRPTVYRFDRLLLILTGSKRGKTDETRKA